MLKEFSVGYVLHDQKYTFFCLDDLIKIDDMSVSDRFQDLYLAFYPIYIHFWSDLLLIDNLYCHLLACRQVHSHVYLTECSYTDISA